MMSYGRILLKNERATLAYGKCCAGISLLFAIALIVGCGDEVGRVTGTIKLNGKSVGPGRVTFRPQNVVGNNTPSGTGKFKEDGAYVIKVSRGLEELPVGDYFVIIDGTSPQESGDDEVIDSKVNPIPLKYLDPEKSGLKAKVVSGENTFDFDLKP